MRESFYQKKKEIESQLSSRQQEYDKDGRAVLNMTVEDDSNFLSVFSPNKNPMISSEVAEFIETNIISISPKKQLTLRIHGNCIDEQEKAVYKNAIHEYYGDKYTAVERELKKDRVIVFSLFSLGVLILAFAILLEYQRGSIIWAEVVDIAAWVLLWEAVDISVFQTRSLRLKRMRYISLMTMNIEYDESPMNYGRT